MGSCVVESSNDSDKIYRGTDISDAWDLKYPCVEYCTPVVTLSCDHAPNAMCDCHVRLKLRVTAGLVCTCGSIWPRSTFDGRSRHVSTPAIAWHFARDNMFDLTSPVEVQSYLAETSFASDDVVTLAGGNSNFTYRITLREPYVASGQKIPIKTLVMKHAEPYIAGWKQMPYGVERQEFECLAFKLVPELVGPSPIVGVPVLFYEDRVNSVMLITDSGPQSRTLKAVLQSGPLSDDISRDIGVALGVFVARLHTATRNPIEGTTAHTIKTVFATHHQAREIISKFFFGRIVSTFTDTPSLLSPPISLSPDTLAKLDVFVRKSQERVNTSNDVFIMGDFWTGNMLIVLEPAPHVLVVDWEGARPGYPGLDLGQFLAELHLLRVFHPESRACVDIIISAFLAAYREVLLEKDHINAKQRLVETAHDTAGRVGAHLITLAPRIPWGGPELTREVVQEGLDYILRSMDGDEAWLRKSIVGGLWLNNRKRKL